MNNHYKQSLFIFWANIIFFALTLLLLLYFKGPNFGDVEGNVILERYMIILTLIGIPGALKLHHMLTTRIINKKDTQTDLSGRLFNIYLLRTFILDTVIIANLVSFYQFENTNFIYMSIITIFALMFTYPVKNLETDEDKNLTENNISEEE